MQRSIALGRNPERYPRLRAEDQQAGRHAGGRLVQHGQPGEIALGLHAGIRAARSGYTDGSTKAILKPGTARRVSAASCSGHGRPTPRARRPRLHARRQARRGSPERMVCQGPVDDGIADFGNLSERIPTRRVMTRGRIDNRTHHGSHQNSLSRSHLRPAPQVRRRPDSQAGRLGSFLPRPRQHWSSSICATATASRSSSSTPIPAAKPFMTKPASCAANGSSASPAS